MRDQILKTRLFSNLGVTLCANAIEFPGNLVLEPDESKAYAEFEIAHACPVMTAYGTMLHPGTLGNSWPLDAASGVQPGAPDEVLRPLEGKEQIARDHILGSMVAVDFRRRRRAAGG